MLFSSYIRPLIIKNRGKGIIVAFLLLLQPPTRITASLYADDFFKILDQQRNEAKEKILAQFYRNIQKRKREIEQAFQDQKSETKEFLTAIHKKDKQTFNRLLPKMQLDMPHWVHVAIDFPEPTYRLSNMRILPYIIMEGWQYGFKKAFKMAKRSIPNFSINEQDEEGKSLLTHAAYCGYLFFVTYLLSQDHPKDPVDLFVGYDSHYEDPYIATPLGRAFEIMRHLKQGTRFPNARGREHMEIVMVLAEKMLSKIIKTKNLEQLQLLIRNNQLLKPILLSSIEKKSWELKLTKKGIKPAGLIAYKGWLKGLQQVLRSMKSTNESQDNSGRTLLMISSNAGHLDLVQELTEKKHTQINQEDDNGSTALTLSCQKGHEKIVEWLVEKGYEKKGSQYHDHWHDALFYAVLHEHLSVVKILIELKKKGKIKGLSINTTSFRNREIRENGKTTLTIAIQVGNKEIVAILLNELAETFKDDTVIKTDEAGRTPTMYAVQCNQPVILEYLLNVYNTIAANNIQKIFIESVNQKDRSGYTALSYAAFNGYAHMVPTLVKAGANVNTKTNSMWTATMFASKNGHLAFLKAMYQATEEVISSTKDERIIRKFTIDINAVCSDGMTAVAYAGMNNHLAIVKFLVKKKANLLIVYQQQLNIFLHVCQLGHTEIVNYLLTITEDPAVSNLADDSGKVANDRMNAADLERRRKTFRESLIYTTDRHKRTALMLATINNHLAVVKALIAHEKAEYQSSDSEHEWTWYQQDLNGWSILHWAAAYGRDDILDYFLHGENDLKLAINSKGNKGETALIVACEQGKESAVKILVEAGADIEHEDNGKNDALSHVLQGSSSEHARIARYLYSMLKKKHNITASVMEMEKLLLREQDDDNSSPTEESSSLDRDKEPISLQANQSGRSPVKKETAGSNELVASNGIRFQEATKKEEHQEEKSVKKGVVNGEITLDEGFNQMALVKTLPSSQKRGNQNKKVANVVLGLLFIISGITVLATFFLKYREGKSDANALKKKEGRGVH